MMTRHKVLVCAVSMTIALLSGCNVEQVHRAAAVHGVTLTDTQAQTIAAWHGQPRSVPDLIRRAWKGTGHEERAVRIAKCESGFNPAARNGQYRGIFQMGAREWATYGHGGNPYNAADNIAAAKRYWDRSGWRPWQCKG